MTERRSHCRRSLRRLVLLLAVLPAVLLTGACGGAPRGEDFAFWREKSVHGLRFFGQEARRLFLTRDDSLRRLLTLQPSSGASAGSLLPSETQRLNRMFEDFQRLSYREQAR